MEPKNLKLIARTDENLRIISANLQDSIVITKDIAKLKVFVSLILLIALSKKILIKIIKN